MVCFFTWKKQTNKFEQVHDKIYQCECFKVVRMVNATDEQRNVEMAKKINPPCELSSFCWPKRSTAEGVGQQRSRPPGAARHEGRAKCELFPLPACKLSPAADEWLRPWASTARHNPESPPARSLGDQTMSGLCSHPAKLLRRTNPLIPTLWQVSTDSTHVVLSWDLSLSSLYPTREGCRHGTLLKWSAAALATISTYFVGWHWGSATVCVMTAFLFIFMCNHKGLIVRIMHDIRVTFLFFFFISFSEIHS